MQAYIANLSEDFTLSKIKDKTYIVYFSGCDFKCPFCFVKELSEFKNEHLILLKDLKKNIEVNIKDIDSLLLTGGEPGLQRQAVLEIARYARMKNLKVIYDTNGSKPETLKSLLMGELVDIVNLDIKSPFEKILFEKTTRSSTFFKQTEEIIKDIRQSISLLRESKITVEITTTIVPSIIFKKEDILEIASIVNNLNCIWNILPFVPGENHIDKNFRNISSPTEKFIENIKQSCLEKFPNLNIR